MTEPLVVRREIHIAAPPATVFAFLTDPQKIVSDARLRGKMEQNRRIAPVMTSCHPRSDKDEFVS